MSNEMRKVKVEFRKFNNRTEHRNVKLTGFYSEFQPTFCANLTVDDCKDEDAITKGETSMTYSLSLNEIRTLHAALGNILEYYDR